MGLGLETHLHLEDAVLDGAGYGEANDVDGAHLADAVNAVDGLFLRERVPPRLADDHGRGAREIEPDTALEAVARGRVRVRVYAGAEAREWEKERARAEVRVK